MTNYIESGIYTNHAGTPSIYIGKYKTKEGKLRDSFCDVPIKINDVITRENIIKFLKKNGTSAIKYIILAPEYTGYNYGYIGKLPQDLYQPIKKMADDWNEKTFVESAKAKHLIKNLQHQNGGIYTKYNGCPAIYIGEYEDSRGTIKKCFCEVPMPFSKNTTREDVIDFLRRNGTKVLDTIIMLHPDNLQYNYDYLGQLPGTLYRWIDKRAKEWSTIPWTKN